MPDRSVYEAVERHLFHSRAEAAALTPRQQEVKGRLMLCVSKLLDKPMTPDADLVAFLMGGCGGACAPVSRSQAYRDVAAVSRLVGNIRLSSKAWYRYMIVEGAKSGYEMARKAGDAKGMAANLDKIGKYTRADKEDDDFDWRDMLPPSWEPTDDVTVLEGMEPMPDLEERRAALRRIWKKDLQARAEDAEPSAGRSPNVTEG